ncbi:MAG: motility associated factor glycosyltransferase family protein, partial [Nitrospinota bacterium]
SGKTVRFKKQGTADNVRKLYEKKLFNFSEVIILLGAGVGETLAETLKSTDPTGFVLLIESNLSCFRKLMEGFDLSESLSDPRVSISVGENPVDAVMSRMEREFGIFTRPNFHVIKNSLSVSSDADYYRRIDNVLVSLKAIAESNLKSISGLSQKWHSNIFLNLPHILKSRGIKPLFGKMKGIPAVIVAAGPSLDKNCRWLKRAEKSVVIICVDTALKTLKRFGVRPHFVVSLDAKPENYTHMQGVDSTGYTLIANPITFPLILSEHTADILMTSYTEPLVKWLERYTGGLGENVTGGSVATSAFDFAHRLGCSPIILTGQDLAYSGQRTHSGGGAVQEMMYGTFGQPISRERMHSQTIGSNELQEAEGNMGQTVSTSKEMNTWKGWFEIRIEKESIDCVNATEGGLAIKGARRLCLQEAVTNIEGKSVGIDGIIKRSLSTRVPSDTVDVEAGFDKLLRSARLVKNAASLGAREAVRLQDFAQQKNCSGIIKNSTAACTEYVRSITAEREFMSVIQWRIESSLDKIQRLQSGLRPSDAGKRAYLNGESYIIFFRTVYIVSREFERNVRSLKSRSTRRRVREANVC